MSDFPGTGNLTTSVDLGANLTTIYAGPCLLVNVAVTSVLSAHDVLIMNGTTERVGALDASTAQGTIQQYDYKRCDTKLVVDPDDSSTGTISVTYRPYHDGLAG